MRERRVLLSAPLQFTVNFIEDDSIITKDGKCGGIWESKEKGFFQSKVDRDYDLTYAQFSQNITDAVCRAGRRRYSLLKTRPNFYK